jgi:hypothetical protein
MAIVLKKNWSVVFLDFLFIFKAYMRHIQTFVSHVILHDIFSAVYQNLS